MAREPADTLVVTALGFIVYYGLTAQYSLMLMTDLKFSPQDAFVAVIILIVSAIVCSCALRQAAAAHSRSSWNCIIW